MSAAAVSSPSSARGRGRVEKAGIRRAIADGINLARTLGDASASTLEWFVRTVNGQADDGAMCELAAVAPVVNLSKRRKAAA